LFLLLMITMVAACGAKRTEPKGPPPEYEEPAAIDAGVTD
jgi:hypothetical protein